MSDNFTNKRDSEFSSVPESASIFQLTYVSTQTRDMNAADLIGMLNQAQIANDQLGITGLLLHREDSFFQIIEGDQDSVLALVVALPESLNCFESHPCFG